MKKEPLFIAIMAKISIPFNLDQSQMEEELEEDGKIVNKKKVKTLKRKEVKAKEHLEKMSEITKNLSYSDINLLKKQDKVKHSELTFEDMYQKEK